MDFKNTVKAILEGFKQKKIRYGLIGGFALGAHGIPRATVDLDFLAHNHDLPKIKELMEEMGYECVFQTENVSQYVSPLEIFGEVDFLHAFRQISLGMLERAIEKEIFGGELVIKVLKAEDIIGLKVQSAINNETRSHQEYADIEALMMHFGAGLDWKVIEEYFSIFDQQTLFNKLKRKYIEIKR